MSEEQPTRTSASFSSLSRDFPSLNLNWSLFNGLGDAAGRGEGENLTNDGGGER